VTIDEKEYLRLGLLLDQVFPSATIQMVTTSIKPSGSRRASEFSRVEEYVFFVMFEIGPADHLTDMLRNDGESVKTASPITWQGLRRRGSTDWRRSHRPNGFYPIFIKDGAIHSIGEPIPLDVDRATVVPPKGCWAAWPLDPEGAESRWQVAPSRLRSQLADGTAALASTDEIVGSCSIVYLKSGDLRRINAGEVSVTGRGADGRIEVEDGTVMKRPKTMWLMESHDASSYGTALLSRFIGDRKFPFPKSLYAVEDTLRFFVGDNPDAIVLDFFAGSATTAHAVMRLNRQDGGRRRCIVVTNNEVSADEADTLRRGGFRPADAEWEALGICNYIARPRLESAVSGRTPEGQAIRGDYKFIDPFPMADGLEENIAFFDLTYEDANEVRYNFAFSAIAPLLWLRAGSSGRCISEVSDGFDIAESYGVLFNVDATSAFLSAVSAGDVRCAFIITDSEAQYQLIANEVTDGVEPVRLYESYFSSVAITPGTD
jgi:adenine-specific DNA-methyltransferase